MERIQKWDFGSVYGVRCVINHTNYITRFYANIKSPKKYASVSPRSEVTKVTNIKTGEFKIFRSLKKMCECLGFPRGSVMKAKKADRLYKNKYKFEYVASPVIE